LIELTFDNKNVLDDAELYEAFKTDWHKSESNNRFKKVLDFIQHNDQHRITVEDLSEIRTRTAPLVRHLIETLPTIAHKRPIPELGAEDLPPTLDVEGGTVS
jgi:hypothetical protein